MGVAVGPVGRGATGNIGAGDGGVAPAYSYAHSKGLFAGISLEGSVVATRADVNAKFYGRDIDARTLLFGNFQPRPRAARPLYDALDEAIGVALPEGGFRPSRMFEKGPPRCRQYGGPATGGTMGSLTSPPPLDYGSAMATPMPPAGGAAQVGHQKFSGQ
uniref:Ysc84 actin-binding domain-containing protein n=1 Tax=Odontella aurita TaxID=265563 RepID=A0A6U6L6M6_9STRA